MATIGVTSVSANGWDDEDELDEAAGWLDGLPEPVGEPDPILAGCDIVEMFAGPGGWSTGLDIIRPLLEQQPVVAGVDFSADACATATAAGHTRLCRSATEIDPRHYPRVRGAILSAPCPTWSTAGRGSAHHTNDGQVALDSITCLGSGCGCDYAGLGDRVGDRRTALIVEILRWAVLAPGLEWVVAEQVPSAEFAFVDIAAELYSLGWEYVNVVVLDATPFGAPSRRRRVFLLGHKIEPVSVSYGHQETKRSMAAVLGWPAGEKVRTRGARRATGGNLFSADGPSWCLTGKARSWERDSDGVRLTAAEAGLLQGFPSDYPWQGSRTSQFQQAGDVVSPLVAAAALGGVLQLPHGTVRHAIEQYADRIYDRSRTANSLVSRTSVA